MTRDDAIAALRTGLSGLPHHTRAPALVALDQLIHHDAPRRVLQQAYEILTQALPAQKLAVDRLAVDWIVNGLSTQADRKPSPGSDEESDG